MTAQQRIYLDYNGTTPVAPEVADAMWPHLTQQYGNPSSTTPEGRAARAALETAREQVAELIGAHADEIIFTSGGTESNNLAIRGAASHAKHAVAITSQIEHPATEEAMNYLEHQADWTVHRLPVDTSAKIDLAGFPSGPTGLGSLILAHNEVGTIQPMRAFSDAIHDAGGVVHADAAQAVGKVPLSVDALGVDLLSIAGHKLYAPKGIGALFIRRGIAIDPVLRGAGQERGIRPGTENVASAVGLGVAAQLANRLLQSEHERQLKLREQLWQRLDSRVDGLRRISPSEDCLPNTLMMAAPGRIGSDILDHAEHVSASTGSACHAGSVTPSAALLAMGVELDVAGGALRLSLGRFTSEDDIASATDDLVNQLTSSSSFQ